MKVKYYFLFFIVFFYLNVFYPQQDVYIRMRDSLLKLIPLVKGEQGADVLNGIADIYFDRLEDPENSKPYADKALEASLKLNYKKGLAQSYLILARLKDSEEKYDEANQLFFNALMALNLAKKNSFGKYDQIIFPHDDPDIGKIIGDINFHYGVTLGNKLNLSKSVEHYLEALRYYEAANKILISQFAISAKQHGETITEEELTVKRIREYIKAHRENKETQLIAEKSSQILHGIRYVCKNLGYEFSRIKDNNQALYYLKKGLRNAEEVGAFQSYLKILKTIGDHYFKIKEYDSCIVYATKLRLNSEKQKEVVFIALADKLLGQAYSEKGELLKAVEYNKHIDLLLEPLRNGTYKGNELYSWVVDDEDAKSVSLTQSAFNYVFMGDIYSKTGQHTQQAKSYYLLAIKTFEVAAKFNAIPGVSKNDYGAFLNRNIGELYSKAGQYTKGIKLLEEAIPEMEKTDDNEELLSFYKTLYEAYDRNGDSKNSYNYYKKYIALKDSVFGQQNSNKIAEIQKRFEVEKKDADIELLNKAQEAQASELEKQKFIRNGFIGGFLILTIFAFIIFRSLRQNKKAKKIIEYQKELVDEKQNEIISSIRYAKRIQQAMLPSDKFIDRILKKKYK